MPPGPKPKYHELISLRIEPELRKLLEELADKEDRTTSQMTRILLREAIVAREGKRSAEKKSRSK